MNKKISIMIVFLMLFVSVITPCVECYGKDVKYSSRHVIENKESFKIESVCRCQSISPHVKPVTMNYMYYDVVIEKKDILSEEFESVIYDIKYRPQQARKNVTKVHTEVHPVL